LEFFLLRFWPDPASRRSGDQDGKCWRPVSGTRNRGRTQRILTFFYQPLQKAIKPEDKEAAEQMTTPKFGFFQRRRPVPRRCNSRNSVCCHWPDESKSAERLPAVVPQVWRESPSTKECRLAKPHNHGSASGPLARLKRDWLKKTKIPGQQAHRIRPRWNWRSV